MIAPTLVVLAMLAAGAAAATHAPAPTVDGVLTPGEWEGARSVALAGGGELFVLHSADSLYVAVRGTDKGIAHLCLASANGVAVLHASAALGTARYVSDDSRWRLERGFTSWEVRDSPQTGPPTREQADAFYAAKGWLANSSASGIAVREFRIRRPVPGATLAAAHLDIATMAVAHAPAASRDDCANVELVRGNTPELTSFAPAGWLTLD